MNQQRQRRMPPARRIGATAPVVWRVRDWTSGILYRVDAATMSLTLPTFMDRELCDHLLYDPHVMRAYYLAVGTGGETYDHATPIPLERRRFGEVCAVHDPSEGPGHQVYRVSLALGGIVG